MTLDCPFCGEEIDVKNIGATLLDTGIPKIKCHGCQSEIDIELN